MSHIRFIITATLTYIPFTVFWFFWHNNLFPDIFYRSGSLFSIDNQNIWAMNFANALLVYGFVYFYFHAVKKETRLANAILWGVYFCTSAVGFYSFLNFGMLNDRNHVILLFDMLFAFIGGAFSGLCVFYLYKRIIGN